MRALLAASTALVSLVAPTAAEARAEKLGPSVMVGSTAYCLTGTMANGEGVHRGAVASNMHPLGTLLKFKRRVWVGGIKQRYFRVKDRIGHGSQLDVWLPSCGAAIVYGRQLRSYRVVYRPYKRPLVQRLRGNW